jgi:streptomycin 6-kinase
MRDAPLMMGGPQELAMPVELVAAAECEGREEWLKTLPARIRQLEATWSITVEEPFQPGGQTAWVGPVRGGGADLVIKVLWRHPEAEHEAEGLRVWDGNGAVRLHAACEVSADTTALLLERCRPGTALRALPEPEQDLVIASLLRRLWIQAPAGHRFRSLQTMCDLWADEFEQKNVVEGGASLDLGLVREAMTLFRELPASAESEVLLCTDLHAGNVLAAEREPWLVIDAKPYVGDPTYDALQHMLNCDARLHADPHGLVRRMADLLGLEAERLAVWLFARCVQESAEWPQLANVARRVAPA